jgi:hypothetical protein
MSPQDRTATIYNIVMTVIYTSIGFMLWSNPKNPLGLDEGIANGLGIVLMAYGLFRGGRLAWLLFVKK